MFDAKKEADKIIKFIKDYYKKNNLKGAVIGISGGKDSGVVAALFARAIGSENVLGVTMPCMSKKEDKIDAIKVADKYGLELINIDLTSTYKSFLKQINLLGDFREDDLKNSNINIKPRLRMSTLYYLAALYSNLKHGTYLVAGTSNKCELYVGYFTKGGDSSYDIGVLNDLTVEEVIQIGEYLEVPDCVLHKTPSDGLSGMSDEDKLGVTYKEIADVINGNTLNKKVEKLHNSAKHKFNTPIYERK